MYYQKGMYEEAYGFLVKGFNLEVPTHVTSNLRPHIYNKLIPYLLVSTAYYTQNSMVGKLAAERYLSYQYDQTMASYLAIFDKLIENDKYVCENKIDKYVCEKINNNVLCFVADGGFKCWSGSSIEKEGVNGSETYIIEMATHMKKLTEYTIYVFCN